MENIVITHEELEELAVMLNIKDKHILKHHIGGPDIDYNKTFMLGISTDIVTRFYSLNFTSIYNYARFRANENFGNAISGIKFAPPELIEAVFNKIISTFKELGYTIEE